jgi:hypothetical protein
MIENTTEIITQNDLIFQQWNNSQESNYKITSRKSYNFPDVNIVFSQYTPKKTKDASGKDVVYGESRIFNKLPNGRDVGLYIELPTVIARTGFKTQKEGKAMGTISIPIVLYRSNPDHLMFINGMNELLGKAFSFVLENKSDFKPGTKNLQEISKKFGKTFRYEVVDDIEDPESDKVYFYLNPLDYLNVDTGESSKMKFYLPFKKEGKDEWEEISWDQILDKPIGFECIPQIKLMKIYHGSSYSFTIKCTSCVILRVFKREIKSGQDTTLQNFTQKIDKNDILSKFSVISTKEIIEKSSIISSETFDDSFYSLKKKEVDSDFTEKEFGKEHSLKYSNDSPSQEEEY